MTKALPDLAGTKDRSKVSGQHQLFAIIYIVNETMGKSRRKGSPAPMWTRPLSLAVIAKKAGCTKDRIAFDLADAERRGLIESLSAEQAKAKGLPPAEGSTQAKRYRVLARKWATAKPYEPPKIAIVKAAAPAPAPPDPDDDPDDHDDDVVATADKPQRITAVIAPAPPRHVTMTIEPGQQVKPQLGPASAYRFQALVSFPVELDARNENGVINFLIRESNQQVAKATVGRTSYGHKSGDSDRKARLAAELAARRLPVTPTFAVSLAGKLGTCDLEFFFRRLDQRIKRSTKFTSALLPDICVEVAQEWKVTEPVEREFRERIERAERQGEALRAERDAYWDSPEGRAKADQLERELEESRKRETARQARIAACNKCRGKGTVTVTYRPNPGSIDTKKRDVPCECAKED